MNNLIRHLYCYREHGNDNDNGFRRQYQYFFINIGPVPVPGCERPISNTTAVHTDWLHEIKSEGAALVSGLHAKGYIPQSAICEVVTAFNNMSASMVAHSECATSSAVLNAECDDNTASTVKSLLQENLVTVNEPLGFLSSTWKQDTYFDSHPLAVKPQTVDVGP